MASDLHILIKSKSKRSCFCVQVEFQLCPDTVVHHRVCRREASALELQVSTSIDKSLKQKFFYSLEFLVKSSKNHLVRLAKMRLKT
jgi:hypothetical protein